MTYLQLFYSGKKCKIIRAGKIGTNKKLKCYACTHTFRLLSKIFATHLFPNNILIIYSTFLSQKIFDLIWKLTIGVFFSDYLFTCKINSTNGFEESLTYFFLLCNFVIMYIFILFTQKVFENIVITSSVSRTSKP